MGSMLTHIDAVAELPVIHRVRKILRAYDMVKCDPQNKCFRQAFHIGNE